MKTEPRITKAPASFLMVAVLLVPAALATQGARGGPGGKLPPVIAQAVETAPFSFVYRGRPSSQLLPCWERKQYKNEEADVDALRRKDWGVEFDRAEKGWVDLLDRASRILIPDRGVSNAFYACLADLFIMCEPVAGGYAATVPGTEAYRAVFGSISGGSNR
jgi:hypothetical protein